MALPGEGSPQHAQMQQLVDKVAVPLAVRLFSTALLLTAAGRDKGYRVWLRTRMHHNLRYHMCALERLDVMQDATDGFFAL